MCDIYLTVKKKQQNNNTQFVQDAEITSASCFHQTASVRPIKRKMGVTSNCHSVFQLQGVHTLQWRNFPSFFCSNFIKTYIVCRKKKHLLCACSFLHPTHPTGYLLITNFYTSGVLIYTQPSLHLNSGSSGIPWCPVGLLFYLCDLHDCIK